MFDFFFGFGFVFRCVLHALGYSRMQAWRIPRQSENATYNCTTSIASSLRFLFVPPPQVATGVLLKVLYLLIATGTRRGVLGVRILEYE